MKHYQFIIIIACVLLLDSAPYIKHYISKPYPDTRQEVTKKGTIFSNELKEISYINGANRSWGSWCPLVNRKPRNYGKEQRK